MEINKGDVFIVLKSQKRVTVVYADSNEVIIKKDAKTDIIFKRKDFEPQVMPLLEWKKTKLAEVRSTMTLEERKKKNPWLN